MLMALVIAAAVGCGGDEPAPPPECVEPSRELCCAGDATRVCCLGVKLCNDGSWGECIYVGTLPPACEPASP